MTLDENSSKGDISEILMVIKNAIIIFFGIIMYIDLPNYLSNSKLAKNRGFNWYNDQYFTYIAVIIFISLILVNIKLKEVNNIFKYSWVTENIIYLSIISSPIYLFNAYESEYKYLYLLFIIYSVIQYGLTYGIITSILSSILIFGADLLFAPISNGVNIYFQYDIILTGVFIFVTWIIGYYVDMENKKNQYKDNTINKISSELKQENIKRQNIEELLLKNRTGYEMLFENSSNAVILHNHGKIIYTNESAVRLLGYEKLKDLNEKIIYEYYDKKDIDLVKEKYFNITNKKLSKVIDEEKILNIHGEVVEVRNTSTFFVYDGKASVLTFLLDITQEKQLQMLKKDVEKNIKLLNESREFNFLITEFFTNISHELKTPINVIYSAIQATDMYLGDADFHNIDKCRTYIKMMKQNCFRMIRLVNNLLDITKIDSGFNTLNRRNDNIVSIVEDITQSVVSYVNNKNIELIFDTNTEEKIMAFDHDKIERIILNLLSNAYKYTNCSGHISVNFLDEGENVVIIVKDDGDGIPQNKIDVIFERFGQANRSLSREKEGSGIGLYLVKAFVELHNGTISVESSEGKGTEFRIIFPVEINKDENDIISETFQDNVERINIEFSDIYSI